MSRGITSRMTRGAATGGGDRGDMPLPTLKSRGPPMYWSPPLYTTFMLIGCPPYIHTMGPALPLRRVSTYRRVIDYTNAGNTISRRRLARLDRLISISTKKG